MNSQAFTPKEIEKGALQDLLNFLMGQNEKLDGSYNDIHIHSDGYCTIVEWFDHHYDNFFGDGDFKYVDSEHCVFKEIHFPDGHYEYARDDEEEKELWEQFHKDNPGWVEGPYGNWINELEIEKARKELEGTK